MSDKELEFEDHDHGCDCGDAGCDCGDSDDACGCGHDHDHGHHHHETITLTLDDDTSLECIVLGVFDVDDQEYIALLPENSDDVFIYIYKEDENGDIDLENIESEEEFDRISQVFLSLTQEDEEFEDEE